MKLRIENVDPQSEVALSLLREAAIDARALYPELHPPASPWPTNPPLPDRGAYVVAYAGDLPLACGALRPIDETTAEVRRMYVHRDHRRQGLARAVLTELQRQATELGYTTLRLETGYKQAAAMGLYESFGYRRIPRFGEYADDPTSVCFELRLGPSRPSGV